ncbi:hypothetical protein AB0L97_07840 [Nocardia sp. NPDC051911]|uniref:hypothetical protein n=1 Tax=Nocardia sp. NPDC051911 TaxID=3154648 RepID=UPI0034316BE7
MKSHRVGEIGGREGSAEIADDPVVGVHQIGVVGDQHGEHHVGTLRGPAVDELIAGAQIGHVRAGEHLDRREHDVDMGE